MVGKTADCDCCRLMEHQRIFCQGTLVRCLADGIARVADRLLAQPVCDTDIVAVDTSTHFSLADDTDGIEFRRNDLVIYVGNGPWACRQCNLASIPLPGLGSFSQRFLVQREDSWQ